MSDQTLPPKSGASALDPAKDSSVTTVHLALGGNLGDRRANLSAAIDRLGALLRIDRLSAVYETAPMYVTDQPAFLNMALSGTTDLAPRELLRAVKRIEEELGRNLDGLRFGPRPIDIDILFQGALVMASPDLEIPHPRIAERAFVLCPLADIAADLRHPALGRTIAELLAVAPGRDSVVRVADALEPHPPSPSTI
ncbi:2-amino-4-hydroxy-6-hydroxymethyldihydropteridine diphosphokinase [Azospirillum doebereinerae]|uniref:2-amino-4-hydroxy-6- hydroxymethyldihydropteridine diphosphokinase n=1 Tax=Azospirillum doebereinerae TaxID=92933 RepID=UPI001EE54618|nr:2-amino-4-hydroxy-6-hydroxymethyldihydropteridine diphosphokinase [Azospirillum doebereinerae]MCG5241661.1 2-amino-4-hydroxy-6-hydroxymethyldihydropteridine diphosphokinase [Azospirillum doebereinerae]